MPWTENPPTDVAPGASGHADLHNGLGRAVTEVHQKVDAIPAPEVTKAQFDALAARVKALEDA